MPPQLSSAAPSGSPLGQGAAAGGHRSMLPPCGSP